MLVKLTPAYPVFCVYHLGHALILRSLDLIVWIWQRFVGGILQLLLLLLQLGDLRFGLQDLAIDFRYLLQQILLDGLQVIPLAASFWTRRGNGLHLRMIHWLLEKKNWEIKFHQSRENNKLANTYKHCGHCCKLVV